MDKNLVIFAGKQGIDLERFVKKHQDILSQWDTRVVCNGDEVIKLLQGNQCDLVFASMQLDDMKGKELLQKISKKHTSVVRYILADHIDTGVMLDTESLVHQYIVTSIETENLKGLINNSLGLRKLFVDKKLIARISSIDSLPSPPKLYNRIVSKLKGENTSINDVAELIGKDMGISTKLFKMVNSAYFGLNNPVENINNAISVLGLETVKSIVFSAGVFEQFDGGGVGVFSFDKLYASSVKVGAQARLICHMMGFPNSVTDESLMAGMLHNVGKLIMLKEFYKEFEQAVELSNEKSIPLYQAERKIIGTDDAKMGAFLLSLWGMPDSLLKAIAFHCNPSEAPSQQLDTLATVHLAYAFDHNDRNNLRLKDLISEKSAINMEYVKRLGLQDNLQDLCQVSAGAVA